VDNGDDIDQNHNNGDNSTVGGPALSKEVAALFQVQEPSSSQQPGESSTLSCSSLLLGFPTGSRKSKPQLDEDDENDNTGVVAALPRLNLEHGPLSPRHLLDLPRDCSAQDCNDAIRHVLTHNPPETLLQAAQRLRRLSTVAQRDVQRLGSDVLFMEGDKDRVARRHSLLLPYRCRVALNLLLQSSSPSSSRPTTPTTTTTRDTKLHHSSSCNHLSAIQLVLAEMDPILESLVPPEEERQLESHWRIRDLMATLRNKLGLPLSLVLHILVGPLNGVCLRNLVWHGYVAANQDVKQWAHLLWLVVALGLGPHATTPVETPNESATDARSSFVIPDPSEVETLLCNTPFVPHTLRPALHDALHLLGLVSQQQEGPNNNLPEHKGEEDEGRLWRSLALLFSVLERGIRHLYARENRGVVPDDIELARTDRLHITMSTMLLSTIEENNKSDKIEYADAAATTVESEDQTSRPCFTPNKLHDYLGEGAINALYDEFVWMGLPDAMATFEGGPEEPMPCRNELVHGVMGLNDVSPRTVRSVAKIAVGLAAVTATRDEKEQRSQLHPRVQQCLDWIMEYQPRRHPACQVWKKFRSLTIGDSNVNVVQSLDELLRGTTAADSHEEQLSQRSSDTVLDRRVVEYCEICSLPPEYCCYTPSALKCLQQRFGAASSISLIQALSLAFETRKILPSTILSTSAKKESGTVDDDDDDDDESVLNKKLNPVRQRILAVLSQRTNRKINCENFGVLFQEIPPRRWAPENELNKLWMIRETLGQCSQMTHGIYMRLLQLLAEAACERKMMRMGRKKELIVAIINRLCVILQTVEILLLMAFHQYLASELTSIVFPTFLSMCANTLSTFVENGRLKYCVAMSAGLVLRTGDHNTFGKRLIELLPPADRGKFALDIDKYILFISGDGEPKTREEDLIKNKFALNSYRRQEASGKGVTWFGLRRWQLIANNKTQEI